MHSQCTCIIDYKRCYFSHQKTKIITLRKFQTPESSLKHGNGWYETCSHMCYWAKIGLQQSKLELINWINTRYSFDKTHGFRKCILVVCSFIGIKNTNVLFRIRHNYQTKLCSQERWMLLIIFINIFSNFSKFMSGETRSQKGFMSMQYSVSMSMYWGP